MKTQLIILILIAGAIFEAQAQPDGRAAREEMKKFAGWIGTWKGQSNFQMGDRVSSSTVEENLQWKLDGLVIMFEGTGKRKDPASGEERTVHNALGLLTYDGNTKAYAMKSYLADGRSTDAWFKVIDDHHYEWGFDTGAGKMKYAITTDLVANTWNEVGTFSKDGSDWKKFFEMNLKKQ